MNQNISSINAKICMVTGLMAVIGVGLSAQAQQGEKHIEHKVVFQEDEKYGGWPANHGIWAWGG